MVRRGRLENTFPLAPIYFLYAHSTIVLHPRVYQVGLCCILVDTLFVLFPCFLFLSREAAANDNDYLLKRLHKHCTVRVFLADNVV
jgi:hypothetical protein